MKPLLLWDVDGTLLDSNDIGHAVYLEAASEVVGADVKLSNTPIFGKTDLINSQNILRDHGLSQREFDSGVQQMLELIPRILQRLVDEGEFKPDVLPGVHEILSSTETAGALNTLLTGNLPESASVKMKAAGLDRHLRLDIGAYGADAATRPELLRIARERAAESGFLFEDADIWIIGDTPHDFEVAEHSGIRCLLVATGSHSFDELACLGADAVVPDLTDTALILKTLLS